jgi:cis-3-alkyl-4-acyloxetan-2-one decarboxylase
MTAFQTIAGVNVHVDGDGRDTILMLHGWPDTWRLWDATVAALCGRYRCARFTLPGFEASRPRRGHSLDEVLSVIAAVADAVSPDRPVDLLLHDWGCFYGYQFALRHPNRVHRIVGVDVGDAGSPAHTASLSLGAKLAIVAYQGWLAAAWRMGGDLGDRMTRFMARRLRAPASRDHPQRIGAQMNYPYDIAWTGSHGSFKAARPLSPGLPGGPMLYLYGRRKPFMFHSPAWVQALQERPACAVEAFDTGHWVMVEAPQRFTQTVATWLERLGA